MSFLKQSTDVSEITRFQHESYYSALSKSFAVYIATKLNNVNKQPQSPPEHTKSFEPRNCAINNFPCTLK
jgi:hypothetical protein